MFSPYYRFARRRAPGAADPRSHCAVNVALYTPKGGRWSMTERGRGALDATQDALVIGPSALRRDGEGWRIDIDEIAAPVPKRIRGSVRIIPEVMPQQTFVLNADGGHVWTPIAPRARVEVALSHPALRWSGVGYFDHNRGDEPLEAGFRDWIWSRAPTRDGAVVLYDGIRRNGEAFALGLRIAGDGSIVPIDLPPATRLASTLWRMPRLARSDAAAPARLLRTLEDAPFYARSVIATRVDGEDVVGIHEALSLDRFAMPIVQAMLPFRMPRRG